MTSRASSHHLGVKLTTLWRFKGCPRCGGDLFIDRDIEGWYEQCLMCAYREKFGLESLTQPDTEDKEGD